MNFSNFKIKTKLIIGFAVPLALLITVATVNITITSKLQNANHWVGHTHNVIRNGELILEAAFDMEAGVRGYLLVGEEEFLEPYYSGKENFANLVTSLKKTVSDDSAQVAKLGELEETISQWQADVADPAIELRRKTGDVRTTNDVAELKGDAKGTVHFDQFREQIAVFLNREDQLMKIRIKKAEAAADSARLMTIGASAAALLISGLIVFILVRGIAKPIGSLVTTITHINDSLDLTQQINVKGKDEIAQLGNSFNGLMDKVRKTLTEVTTASSDVAAASVEIAASAEEIAAGACAQSEQTAQVCAAVEEMSASVTEVARKSSDAAISANASGRIATEGGGVVDQTITGMRAINDAVSSSAVSVQELGKRGEQIGEVIAVINDIADQTNLLALNAAIEAARAGEHGRGFAVVADEVRKLADRTTQATKEISDAIQAIQTETSTAVQKMNAGSDEVTLGVEKAEQAGDSLKQIVASAQDVSSMVQSIAAAAEQQSVASGEVSRSIEQIAAVTRQTSEGTSQAAAAATQLSHRAETLQQLVGQFKIDNGT